VEIDRKKDGSKIETVAENRLGDEMVGRTRHADSRTEIRPEAKGPTETWIGVIYSLGF
jgi:hypothetical protein